MGAEEGMTDYVRLGMLLVAAPIAVIGCGVLLGLLGRRFRKRDEGDR
jgi:hypothetical protein